MASADQVRVTLRMIEVPHPALTGWMGQPGVQGKELHAKAVALALEGGAEIVETTVLTVRSGEKATSESFAEVIYPTEYEPMEFPSRLPDGKGPNPFEFELFPRPNNGAPVSWETRNAGVELEIEPFLYAEKGVVDLRIAFEWVSRAAMTTWTEFRDQWGEASLKMPVFATKKLTGGLTLEPGGFELFNVFTPQPAAVPAALTRMLVFVGAEILQTHAEP
ncbi:hypothetical protein [Luteolibacter marinus]|uniref:hypothetical protein n=1 Tax=Luteolibacter marinus TaxID=2776705 RepID=UPI0018660B40|nr:hypothetical protein [Luteolibacter marinus]